MFLIFPYRIERPFRMPWATIGIMLGCVAVFAMQLAMGLDRSFALLGFRPDATGAITWLTAMFAHGGVGHLLGNLYFLWIFGGVLEDAIGRSRYVMLYLTGGLVSALAQALITTAFDPVHLSVPLVGASGAIAAIMGVAAVRFYRLKLDVWYFVWLFVTVKVGTFGVPALAGVIFYLLREVLDGVMSITLHLGAGVAHWAHVGGLLFGVAVAYTFGLALDLDREEAEREAPVWSALGCGDIARQRLYDAGSIDDVDLMLTRARAALAGPAPDVAAAGLDVRGALHLLLQRGLRADAAHVYREFRSHATTPLFLDPVLLAAVGSGCEVMGDRETAARAYYDVLRLYPSAPESERSLYRLAHVYLAQGKATEAEQTWATFMKHFPSSSWIAHADSRLGSFA